MIEDATVLDIKFWRVEELLEKQMLVYQCS